MEQQGIIQRIMSQERDAVREVTTYLGETSLLGDACSALYDLLFDLIRKTELPLDAHQLPAFMHCLQALRYELILGTMTMLRGHVTDSARYSRRAIEVAAFAIEIFKDDDSANLWLSMGTSGRAMDRYRSRFPAHKIVEKHTSVLGKQVSELYASYCLFVHPSFGSLVNQTRFTSDRGHQFHFFEIGSEHQMNYLAMQFFILLDAHVRILLAMVELVKPYPGFDYERWRDASLAFTKWTSCLRANWKDAADQLLRTRLGTTSSMTNKTI
jgi:hypothetical protein